MPNNYLKLSIRAPSPLHDAEAVPQAASAKGWPLISHGRELNSRGEHRAFVTTWIFPFTSTNKASAFRALAAAQQKRKRMTTKHFTLPPEAFQLAAFAPSVLTGVRVLGAPIKKLRASELGDLEVVAS